MAATATKWGFCFTLTIIIAVCFSQTAAEAVTKNDPKAAKFLGGRGGAFGIQARPQVLAMTSKAGNDGENAVVSKHPNDDWAIGNGCDTTEECRKQCLTLTYKCINHVCDCDATPAAKRL
ncbi:OLC1v1021541C1 [Oldenlandia corymbosa var. corymbosa]|uniref:OLC1v1021541C1 n=1 Tax=Oldenlandia corymbosa var. corymbosa TaxID=529605 RepID=A0AAV1BVW1_OLDCO|nr:OLC1v1021541C1 [Oldenlandia corymbosa var. corymbosa]